MEKEIHEVMSELPRKEIIQYNDISKDCWAIFMHRYYSFEEMAKELLCTCIEFNQKISNKIVEDDTKLIVYSTSIDKGNEDDNSHYNYELRFIKYNFMGYGFILEIDGREVFINKGVRTSLNFEVIKKALIEITATKEVYNDGYIR